MSLGACSDTCKYVSILKERQQCNAQNHISPNGLQYKKKQNVSHFFKKKSKNSLDFCVGFLNGKLLFKISEKNEPLCNLLM